MPGMEFEYDEQGTTFYYFILAVLVLILLPWTIILWRKRKSDSGPLPTGPSCNCELCVSKRDQLKQKPTSNKLRSVVSKTIFFVLWILFFAVLYKVSTIEMEFHEFDPYAELEIDQGASMQEIKKAFRELSLKYHPDRPDGDSKRFIRLGKAHETLTNEETKKNWEEYGNPDGPGAMHFGIALPKWLVEKKNSMIVLAVYGFAFMIVLPTVVGVWWYRSIRFSAEHVLLETEDIYKYFFRKHPNCLLKKVIHILSISREFGRQWNQEIIERPSDNTEVPSLIRKLPSVVEQPREMPYILKTRSLIHAHLSRVPLPQSTLEQDRRYIVRKCPLLVGEMVSLVSQFCMARIMYNWPAHMLPRLNTVETVMSLYPMIVQACWDNKSNLMQLPHFTEELVRGLSNRRGRSIRNIHDLANLSESDRRQALWQLSDDQFRDVVEVLRHIPHLDVDAKPEVIDVDDEDPSITAGSIVTVLLHIRRGSLGEVMANANLNAPKKPAQIEQTDQNGEEGADGGKVVKKQETKPWQRHGRKKGGKNAADPRQQHKAAKQSKQQQAKEKAKLAAVTNTAEGGQRKPEDENNPENNKNTNDNTNESDSEKENESTSESADAAGEQLNESERDDVANGEKSKKVESEDDEDERRWRRFNEATKRENDAALAGMDATQAPIVHCPYLPSEKRESWWVYLCDRKQMQLHTLPIQVTGLKTSKSTKSGSSTESDELKNQDDSKLELPIKFKAPVKPGIYQYAVCVRSDSYLGVDAVVTLKLDVRAAPAVPQQIVMTDSEDEHEESESEDDNQLRRRRRNQESEEESEDDWSGSESGSD